MNDDDLDVRSAAEAARIRDQAASIAGTEGALADLLRPTLPVIAARRPRPRRRLVAIVGGGIAAAVTTVVVIGVAVERTRDDVRPTGPASSAPVVEPDLVTTTASPPVATTGTVAPSLPTPASTAAPTTDTPDPAPPGTTPQTDPDFSDSTVTAPRDPAGIDMMAGWPQPPELTPDLAAVPMLLPTRAVPGATRVEGAEHAGEPGVAGQYVQSWIGADDPSLLVEITTSMFPNVGNDLATPTTVEGWDLAVLPKMGDGYAGVLMSEPDASVQVWAKGLGQEEVLAIARSLLARPDGQPGWAPIITQGSSFPADMVQLSAGWVGPSASRTVDWFGSTHLATVKASSGVASVLLNGVSNAVDTDVTDIGGVLALASDLGGGRARVAWTTESGVVIEVGYVGTVDDALAFARSLAPVDRAAWEAATTPAPTREGECGFFGC